MPPSQDLPADFDPADRLRWRRAWLAVGAALVLLVVYASLRPSSGPTPFAGFDKLGHLLAYAGLMAWYAQLYPGAAARRAVAAALVGLGVVIEFLQPLVGRQFEWWDMLADAAGVGLALLGCRGRGGRWLQRLESALRRSADGAAG